MPIYEYLCRECNRIFQFLVREASSGGICPPCPKCSASTTRVLSRFSIAGPPPGSASSADDAGMDALAGEDPRAMASAIRRMADEMGEPLEPEVQEALTRLESGEDPERIEQDLERGRAGGTAPVLDDGLYEPPPAFPAGD